MFREWPAGDRRGYPIAHGPGPPQRPHIPSPAGAPDDFGADSAPTANTLSARAVFGEPHFGHFTAASLDIDRCN